MRALQARLNQRRPQASLKVDGIFGPATRRAVVAFQQFNWLAHDGIVGPVTITVLNRAPRDKGIRHRVRLIPQPNPFTCWSAATAMLTDQPIGTIRNKLANELPHHYSSFEESIEADRERNVVHEIPKGTPKWGSLLTPTYGSSEEYKEQRARDIERVFGLKCIRKRGYYEPFDFCRLIAKGPVMIEMANMRDRYIEDGKWSGHACILAGARFGADPSCATFLLYDPEPVNKGLIVAVDYNNWHDICHRLTKIKGRTIAPHRTVRVWQRQR